jgi:hypothetical protein
MRKFTTIFCVIIIALITMSNTGCENKEMKSDTGVKKASAVVKAGSDGLTAEQRNVKKRLEKDNEVGAIKHLYVISAYSGQVVLYSTVDTKVTSSGKRLTPKTVNGNGLENPGNSNFVNINGDKYTTNELIEDDGTFGSSIEYLYWFDQRGAYHQHYISGGQIIHISDQPLAVKNIILNLELKENQGKN